MTATTFEDLGLRTRLGRTLRQLGFRHPWPIQREAIPAILEGQDLLGLAPTGSGKTVAYAAPTVQRLLGFVRRRDVRSRRPGALVVVPTRELARQVADDTAAIAKGTKIEVTSVYGKVGMGPQAARLARGIDIVVGTPGRIRELVEADHLDLSTVEILIVDEADRLLDLGFRPQIGYVIRHLKDQHQTLMFTATMPEEVEQFVTPILQEPVRCVVGPPSSVVEHVQQHLFVVSEREKVPALLELFRTQPSRGALVFCRTRRRVGWVATALSRQGMKVASVHGDRTQPQRIRALEDLEAGRVDVVVATDVASRGLHLPSVDTVVNYDLPMAPEDFVHRIGRAGHGGGTGTAYTLLSPKSRQQWFAIAEKLGLALPERDAPGVAATVTTEPGSNHGIDKNRRRKRRPGRRGAAAPIKRGEKPGTGVRRPE